ncbi:hypothetical protein NP493_22g01005 [Ridgeia piscesae]|uniref:MARVEL domain-containing protein n=1 Tax=Ridgeia piscesae TaxID=27915 RepID=A0AAD9PDE6_RIDPI|nr:hypothetical protein NP493_22g01005 [Ridgeia piscesae]
MVVTEYQGGNETYTTETRQEGGRTSKVFGLLDMRYLKGIPGLLKAFEAGLSLIGYICVETSIQCLSGITTYGFFKFVTLLALITTLILWAVLLLQIHTRILKCDCFDWPFIEICYYGFIIVLYFFADVFLGIHACTIGHKAGDAFGWFAWVAFCIDFLFCFYHWRQERKRPQTEAVDTPSEPRY